MHRSIGHQCCDQLTAVKTGYLLTSITWPYRGLRCWPIEVEHFFEVIRWQVTSFQMIAGSSLIVFYFIWNMFCYCAAQLKYWIKTDLGRENLNSYYRQGRQLLLTLLTMVTRWSCSTSNFYALIGQNMTGDLMRIIYAASWILFTLTAEANRVLCQLVMFLTVFFHWMHKMKFSCYQESSVIHGQLVFGWENNTLLVKVGNSISDGIDFPFNFAWCVRVEKSEAILAFLDTF